MVVRLADYVASPLAFGTHETYEALKDGKSCLRRYEGWQGVPEPFVASLFPEDMLETEAEKDGITADYTRFERLCILTACRALAKVAVDASAVRTLFVLATTKGDIGTPLGHTATRIARWFGNDVQPLVVCNACISGLHALIEAKRMLEVGLYDHVVVIGADLQTPFVVSGFLSLKALSAEPCRPFDEDRTGLNLGDAAACIVMGRVETVPSDMWQAVRGVVHNDAFHISSPSKQAEGCFRALKRVTEGFVPSDIDFVNLHGTATMYNDEMEAVGMWRARLTEVPANSLKGYLGHTMGAAGIIETLISMEGADDGLLLGTRGYRIQGISRPLAVTNGHRPIRGRRFVKAISGFGGSNAAMLFEKGGRV